MTNVAWLCVRYVASHIVKSAAVLILNNHKLKSGYKTYWRIKFGGSLKTSPTAKFNSLS